MGSPLSPIVANIYMEIFEQKALELTYTKPDIWLHVLCTQWLTFYHTSPAAARARIIQ